MAVGCELAMSNAMEEDLKEGYFVFDGFEKGVEAQGSGISEPLLPVCVGAGGSIRSDSTLYVCLRSTEVTEERMEGCRCTCL